MTLYPIESTIYTKTVKEGVIELYVQGVTLHLNEAQAKQLAAAMLTGFLQAIPCVSVTPA